MLLNSWEIISTAHEYDWIYMFYYIQNGAFSFCPVTGSVGIFLGTFIVASKWTFPPHYLQVCTTMRDDYQPWEVKRQAMIKKPEEMQRATGRMDHLTTFKAIQDSCFHWHARAILKSHPAYRKILLGGAQDQLHCSTYGAVLGAKCPVDGHNNRRYYSTYHLKSPASSQYRLHEVH